MKKVIVSLSLILGAGLIGYAQETTATTSKMRLYRMESTTTTPVVTSELSKEEEIQNCKNHLDALDKKEAWIRSNPEEMKIATENGWFEDAAATRSKLLTRIKELESK